MMPDPLKFIGAMILGIILIATGGIWLGNTLDESRCRNTAEAMGVEYRYSINTPCMVKANGQFVPLSAFKVMQ
jgi:hypothetical protein